MWKIEAASLIVRRHVSAFSAEVVNRLRIAGAVIIGRATMDEFGVGFSSVSCVRGPVFSAWAAQALGHLETCALAGGSSGGCATMALGPDTGGSVRQPAFWMV
ncbi:MAG: amidase family protein [Candidatus Hodgkinia cicadicola]